MFTVTRQLQWPDCDNVVEVSVGGLDYCNPGMLTPKFKHLGEGQEFSDPREAVAAAIKIRDAWRTAGTPDAAIGYGSTGGMTMFFDPREADEAVAWAEAAWEKLPKCDGCGEPLPDKHKRWHAVDCSDEEFCSAPCAERAAEFYASEEAALAVEVDAEGDAS